MASSPEGWPDDDEDVRWPLVAKLGVALAAVTLIGGLGAAVYAAFFIDRSPEAEPLIADVADPVAPAALPDGGFVYAERTAGRVVIVDRHGAVTDRVDVSDPVAIDGQRGLLGLAVRTYPDAGRTDDGGDVQGIPAQGSSEVYASWTRASDGRLVVGRVLPRPRLIWEGPVSTDLANGGTLAFRGQDELLIGVGELQDPDALADPTTPNGKVLSLDIEGPPDQVPTVVAGGWHNPFALAVVGDEVWLVDNAPGSAPERLVRISAEGTVEVLDLDGKRAPSGLAVDAGGDLLLCGHVSGIVERIPVLPSGVRGPFGIIEDLPCATGVTVLGDGSVVTTTDDAVWRD